MKPGCEDDEKDGKRQRKGGGRFGGFVADEKHTQQGPESKEESRESGNVRDCCSGQEMKESEEESPKRIGESFDVFTGVKRKTLAVREVKRVTEGDIRVIRDVRPEGGLNPQRCRDGNGHPGQ